MCGVLAWLMGLTILLAMWNVGTRCFTGALWFIGLSLAAAASNA